ncbi:MAG: GNAT family N-acetyltransferase [Flavobacteriales bacterium]|jgi:GNAT superfamily N-acetyltransferase|nr:GNAT family N-acetyltransferase [Flavobacteriales bacterium]
MEILLITPQTGKHSIFNDNKIVNFLYEHLDQYGDAKEAIQKCIDYVFTPNKGGLILLAIENNEIVGATIINKTGMSGYIPENILVYIAVNKNQRGKGVGKQIMQKAIENTEGDIALHVEKDNPAKFLYEKMGFSNPYLEMRLKK